MKTLVDNSPENPILLTIEFYLVSMRKYKIHSGLNNQDRQDRLQTIFDNTMDSAGLVTLSNKNLKDMLICCQYDIYKVSKGIRAAYILYGHKKLPNTKFYKSGLKTVGKVGSYAINTAKRIIPMYVQILPLAKKERYYSLVHNNKVTLGALIDL